MPPAAAGERRRITIDGTPGLVLRIDDRGDKTWWHRAQHEGRRRELQIGRFPAMGLPAAKAAVEAARERPVDGATMRDLWRRYAAEHLPKRAPATAAKDAERWRLHVAGAIGGLRVDAVTRDDVARLHAAISRTSPGAANRVLSLLSKMFALAERWGMRTSANPARGHDRNPEDKVERYLTAEEYARLFAALELEPDDVRDAVELVALTGARVGEILERRRADVDATRQRLRLPSSKTGADWLTCSPDAWAVVLRRTTDPLFPITYNALYHRWRAIRSRAQLPGLRMHDLRHAFASVAAGQGRSLPEIGGLLRHKSPATTARYVHLVDAAQRRHAAEVTAAIKPRSKRR
jgi:integrase